jgi:hypothetical protein
MNRASAIVGTIFRFDMAECYAASSVPRSNCRDIPISLKTPILAKDKRKLAITPDFVN